MSVCVQFALAPAVAHFTIVQLHKQAGNQATVPVPSSAVCWPLLSATTPQNT